MPDRILGGRPIFARAQSVGDVLRGRGCGGQAVGPVEKLDPDRPRPVAAGAILVVPTVLPTFAPLLGRVAGIVAERGGLLGHGVALARQLGVPCVVGAVGACSVLEEGNRVWLDGEAGLVARLG
jgi:pyruvate,water dikinase